MTMKTWLLFLMVVGLAVGTQAEIRTPYLSDSHTLHLYHLDESSGAIQDSGSGGPIHLNDVVATYSNTAYAAGYGTSLYMIPNGYYATPTNIGGRAATSGGVSQTLFQAASGAFTYEALIKISNTSSNQYIMSHDGQNTRGWNFFITNGTVAFTPNGGVATHTTTIPVSGPNAFNSNGWFHVAATYNGTENTTSNLLFYWTALSPGVTNANLIGSAQMTIDALANTNNFIVGCLARSPSRLQLMGWIDEVRISDNARGSGEFIFRIPPTVQNAGASNVTFTSADLQGTLSSTGQAATAVLLYWGPTDGNTNAAAWANTNLFASPQGIGSLSTNVTFGVSNAIYYYRFCATNANADGSVVWATNSSTFMPGEVWVQPTTPTAAYGTPGAFTVYRPTTATNGPLTFAYTLSGSASNSLDYTTLSGSVVVPDGASSAIVTLAPTLDMDPTNEEATLTLIAASYKVGTPAAATVTITPWSGLTAITGNCYVAVSGNDTWAGTNWATAFATISNGVGRATNGQTVLVGVGTYNVSTQINVTSNITLLGVGGATNTIVRRDPANISSNRVLFINAASAIVDGFTITNGFENTDAYGGGVLITSGTLRNCLVTGNTDIKPSQARPYGGGVYVSAGLVSNCTIRGNTSSGSYAKGGGVALGGANATVTHCVIITNYANENGGGVVFAGGGKLLNSLIAYNTATTSSGVLLDNSGSPSMVNCTVVSNSCNVGGFALYAPSPATAISNSIIYHNINGDIRASDAAYFGFCCATGLSAGVNGNITNAPLFAGPTDFHLSSASLCIDRGFSGAWQATDRDLDGNLRIQHGAVDMGPYETPAGFGCNLVSDRITGFAPLTNVFTAYVSGTNLTGLYYAWDVNADGVIDVQGSDKQIITNIYTIPGLYSVALLVSNAVGQVDAFTNLNYISVSTASMYVSPTGSQTLPYSTWDTAATSVQAAVSFASDGATIRITNGTYRLANTVTLSLGITLKGYNGANSTVIEGNGVNPCFLLNNGAAVLDGLTVSNGVSATDGGGMTVSTGTVQNCIIRNNSAGRYGGGIYLGNGLVKNCVIQRNASLGNTAPLTSAGGGVYMTNGVVLHCTIADNTAVRGSTTGGDGLVMTGGSVSNSIIYFNSVFPYVQYQRNVVKSGGTFAYSCTIPAVVGTSNTVADPQFADRLAGNYRLLPGSPCIDRGTNMVGLTTDIDGVSRPADGDTVAGAIADMGAYEAEAINAGAFRCNFIAVTNEGVNALSNVIFNAYVAGAVTNVQSYFWDFTNDGSIDLAGAGVNPVSNTYGVGFYSVRLVVTNTSSQGSSVVKPAYVRVASPNLYVSTIGSATLPYDTWAKAATNLNAAVEAAYTVGCTQQVIVTNGQYGLDRQLELLGPIVLTGLGGASNTVAYRTGAYFHRIAYMTSAASVIDGFTITNGYENTASYGGGVLMSTGSLQNCVVIKNTDTKLDDVRPMGGGIYASGGVISNCVIAQNTSSGSNGKAGGLYVNNAVVQRCTIFANNANEGYGGGVILQGASRVENCLIRSNNAATVAFMNANKALIRNCTIVENTGLGAFTIDTGSISCTGLNCIVYNNGGAEIAVASATSAIQYSCASNLTHGSNNNITNDPMFVSRVTGDFRLQPRSPCIDLGISAGWTRADVDLAGSTRWAGQEVDMGAYEAPSNSGTVYVIR